MYNQAVVEESDSTVEQSTNRPIQNQTGEKEIYNQSTKSDTLIKIKIKIKQIKSKNDLRGADWSNVRTRHYLPPGNSQESMIQTTTTTTNSS